MDNGDDSGKQDLGDDSRKRDEQDTKRAPHQWNPMLTRRRAVTGMAAVAGIAAVDVGGFLYTGGWLTPSALTPSRFADRFEQVYGRHDGFRRNHAKGLSATGTFASNGAGVAVSKASVFTTGTVPADRPVFALRWPPDQVDKPDTVRGLALEFLLPNR